MLRCIVVAALWSCIGLAGLAGGLGAAHAIELQCIEASKYKYLYLIFGNNRQKFAEYLQLDTADLPDGEVCRAVVVTGRVDSMKQAKRQNAPSDPDKILGAVSQSRGWLATLYLASPGGNIGSGLATAQMIRLFWLKAESPNTTRFTYWPDFIPRSPLQRDDAPLPLAQAEVPAGLASGWRAYTRAVASFATVSLAQKKGRCASACTFFHVAGIERHGTVHVHRGRAGANTADDRSIADILESLQRAENRIIALYRSMDGGEDFVRLFTNTPSATTRPAVAARYPRYISDLLRTRCKADSMALSDREAKLRASIEHAQAESPADFARLKQDLAGVLANRAAAERCGAVQHEKERRSQYRKYCRDSCNRSQIVAAINARLRELGPVQPRTPPSRAGKRP